MLKEKWCFESKYLIFYFRWGFDVSFEICGYFDNRPRINLDIIFFSLTLILPFENKWTDECDPPKWGIGYHSQTLWIYIGGKGNLGGGKKWYTINMPWQYDWVRTSMLRKDGQYEHNTRKTPKEFYRDEWEDILWKETHPYTYILKSGEIQNILATIKVSEMEHRMRFIKMLPIFNKIRRSIDISFDREVGEGTGSWKGGTIGCSYELEDNETPLESLKRMELNRKFNR